MGLYGEPGLNAAEASQLCAWARALPGVGTEMACGAGVSVIVEIEGTCQMVAAASCEVTVEAAETCLVDAVAQPCTFLPDSCQPLLACAGD